MIKKILELGNLELKEPKKTEFFEALRGLIGIFFAVVIGFGFQQFNAETTHLFIHSAALIVICLSWWGYYWGITCGPKELNVFNVLIDCCLLVVYWMLLNKPQYNEYLYPGMFILYTLWEWVRFMVNDDEGERGLLLNAALCNMVFVVIMAYIFHYMKVAGLNMDADQITIAALILIVTIAYRVIIHNIYKPKRRGPKSLLSESENDLVDEAKRVSSHAYTPVSHYSVGAAILASNGNIYSGCNVEFANLSNTIHAEEAALSKMMSDGELRPLRIAVYTTGETPAYPCGMCLQSLFELGGNDLVVIACTDNERSRKTMTELLPEGFLLESFKE